MSIIGEHGSVRLRSPIGQRQLLLKLQFVIKSSQDALIEVVTEIYDAAGRQVARDVAMQADWRSLILLL